VSGGKGSEWAFTVIRWLAWKHHIPESSGLVETEDDVVDGERIPFVFENVSLARIFVKDFLEFSPFCSAV
jgi:hypothetical protein